MTWDVLISCPSMVQVLDEYRTLMSDLSLNVSEARPTQQMSAEELRSVVGGFDGVIAGDDEFNRDVLQAGADGKLKVISKWGVGTDNIDIEAADHLGITVTNTPGLLGEEVADVALGYIILLARGLHLIDRAVRRGEWFKPTGHSLAGKVLGLVGAGSVGHALTRRAIALGMSVSVFDPSADALSQATALGARPTGLDDLIALADYVVLACPLTPQTFKIMDEQRISMMKPSAGLVNVSRGDLVDEVALIGALQSRRIRAAALDVYQNEPLAADSALKSLDQVILGSHNASNTNEAVRRVTDRAIDNLISALAAGRANS